MMIKRILWALVIIGLLAALVSGAHRRRTEQENQSVEIALDYGELRSLAGSEGKPIGEVLRQFRQAGATSVVLQEDTVGSLEDARRIAVRVNGEQQTLIEPPLVTNNALMDDFSQKQAALLERVETALQHKTRLAVKNEQRNGDAPPLLQINAPYSLVRGVGIGLDPDSANEIRRAGLRIVGRVSNYNNVQPAGTGWVVGEMKRRGVSTVLFSGDDVLGFKGYVTDDKTKPTEMTTESALRANGLNYAALEFGKQKGDVEITRAVQERVVRLHTVTGAEMAAADIPGNVQRFNLAARERNIRMLFVRLFLAETEPLNTNTDYIKRVATGLKKGGLVVGPSHGYGTLTTPVFLRGLIGLGLASAFLLLVDSVTGFFGGIGLGGRLSVLVLRNVAWGGAGLLLLLPVVPVGGYKGVELAALACAFVFPSLGLLHSDKLRPDRTASAPVLVALLRFGTATLVTFIGAAYVVGLLADRLFLIKSEAFVGVKVSELVPVLIVALVYALRLRAGGKRPWAAAVQQARATIEAFLGEPIRWWQVAAAVAVLAVLVLLVMRSGNDPGVGVSGFELKFRSLLDRILPARPRNKAFIFHPCLIVGLIIAVRGRRTWALPLVLAGAIGQADLLNTFCHLHTALPASIARAFLGLLFGVGIGLFVYWLLDRLVLRRLPDTSAFPHAASAGELVR